MLLSLGNFRKATHRQKSVMSKNRKQEVGINIYAIDNTNKIENMPCPPVAIFQKHKNFNHREGSEYSTAWQLSPRDLQTLTLPSVRC